MPSLGRQSLLLLQTRNFSDDHQYVEFEGAIIHPPKKPKETWQAEVSSQTYEPDWSSSYSFKDHIIDENRNSYRKDTALGTRYVCTHFDKACDQFFNLAGYPRGRGVESEKSFLDGSFNDVEFQLAFANTLLILTLHYDKPVRRYYEIIDSEQIFPKPQHGGFAP